VHYWDVANLVAKVVVQLGEGVVGQSALLNFADVVHDSFPVKLLPGE
jgi:hypothetical protein